MYGRRVAIDHGGSRLRIHTGVDKKRIWLTNGRQGRATGMKKHVDDLISQDAPNMPRLLQYVYRQTQGRSASVE